MRRQALPRGAAGIHCANCTGAASFPLPGQRLGQRGASPTCKSGAAANGGRPPSPLTQRCEGCGSLSRLHGCVRPACKALQWAGGQGCGVSRPASARPASHGAVSAALRGAIARARCLPVELIACAQGPGGLVSTCSAQACVRIRRRMLEAQRSEGCACWECGERKRGAPKAACSWHAVHAGVAGDPVRWRRSTGLRPCALGNCFYRAAGAAAWQVLGVSAGEGSSSGEQKAACRRRRGTGAASHQGRCVAPRRRTARLHERCSLGPRACSRRWGCPGCCAAASTCGCCQAWAPPAPPAVRETGPARQTVDATRWQCGASVAGHDAASQPRTARTAEAAAMAQAQHRMSQPSAAIRPCSQAAQAHAASPPTSSASSLAFTSYVPRSSLMDPPGRCARRVSRTAQGQCRGACAGVGHGSGGGKEGRGGWGHRARGPRSAGSHSWLAHAFVPPLSHPP